MKINKSWHEANRMPKNATLDQRIFWHMQHELNCACRPIPQKLQEEIKNRVLNGLQ